MRCQASSTPLNLKDERCGERNRRSAGNYMSPFILFDVETREGAKHGVFLHRSLCHGSWIQEDTNLLFKFRLRGFVAR